jgi:hypothetical protein
VQQKVREEIYCGKLNSNGTRPDKIGCTHKTDVAFKKGKKRPVYVSKHGLDLTNIKLL